MTAKSSSRPTAAAGLNHCCCRTRYRRCRPFLHLQSLSRRLEWLLLLLLLLLLQLLLAHPLLLVLWHPRSPAEAVAPTATTLRLLLLLLDHLKLLLLSEPRQQS
jgi:hypothetical protein